MGGNQIVKMKDPTPDLWVPPKGCWTHLKAQDKQPVSGKLVKDAIADIEGTLGLRGHRSGTSRR